jgi:predicted nucleic acid-binding protein
MPGVVVDTDVVSFVFKKDTRARHFHRHLIGQTLVLSFMTLAELHQWTLERRWGQASRDRLERYLQVYQVYHADDALCRLWAEVSDRARRRGRRIAVADAWIAATALTLNVPLVTHNPADHAGVDGLTLLTGAGP